MTHPGTHPGTAKLQRYVLGELSAEDRLVVDRHVADCPRCRALVEEERRLDELIVGSLGGAPSAGDEDAAFTRLWAALDGDADLGDTRGAPQKPIVAERAAGAGDEAAPVLVLPQRSRRSASWVLSLAAAAAAVLVVVWWTTGREGQGRNEAGRQQQPVVRAPRLPTEGRPIAGSGSVAEADTDIGVGVHTGADTGTASVADGPPRPPSVTDVWEPVDAARLEVARTTVGDVLRAADEQFPFAPEAFRLACDEGLSKLRMQGWPVAALVRGLALGADDQAAGVALRHAALDRSNYLVLARGLESDLRVDDTLAVLDVGAVDVGSSSSLVKALERVAASNTGSDTGPDADGLGAPVSGAARRRAALTILAAGSGPRVSHAWDRVAERTAADLLRTRDLNRAAVLLQEAAELWPPAVAVSLLEEMAADAKLHDSGRTAFLAHASRLDAAAVQRLDDSLARRRQAPVLLPWCVAASLQQVVPTLVRALEEGHEPDNLLPALTVFGGPDVAAGLHGLWRDSHSPNRADRYLVALSELFEADDTLARRFGASVQLEDSESLAELAGALPGDSGRGLLAGALMAPHTGGDLGGYRAALIVALGRSGSVTDGEDLIRWIAERPAHDRLLPLAWAAAGRLAPDAASFAWHEQVGDPRLLNEVVDVVSPRLAAALEPTARTLAPLTAALEQAAAQRLLAPESLPISNSPTMEDLP